MCIILIQRTRRPCPYGQRTGRPSPYGQRTGRPSPYGQRTGRPSPYGQRTGKPRPYERIYSSFECRQNISLELKSVIIPGIFHKHIPSNHTKLSEPGFTGKTGKTG